MSTHTMNARVNLRVDPRLLASIKDAASAKGRKMTTPFDIENSPEVSEAKALSLGLWLVEIAEAAKMLGRTRRTLLRWQGAGKMPERIKHGRWMKFRRSDIEAMTTTKSDEVQA